MSSRPPGSPDSRAWPEAAGMPEDIGERSRPSETSPAVVGDALAEVGSPGAWPADMRPRERLFALGAAALSPQELLAILLGAGSKREGALELARRVLVEAGSLRAFARSRAAEFAAIRGVGMAKSTRLAAAFELGRRVAGESAARGCVVRSAEDVHRLLRQRLREERREVFVVLLLDGRHRLMREEQVSVGTLTASLVHPREVFAPAIRERAAAIVVAHNHPSGDPTPSGEDRAVTLRLAEVGRLIGIPLLDHVVVGDPGYASLRELGHLPEPDAGGQRR